MGLDLGSGASYSGVHAAKKPAKKVSVNHTRRRTSGGGGGGRSSGGGSGRTYSRSYSNRSSSGGGGGGGGGGSSYKAPKPKPKPPSIDAYLRGDADYQNSQRGSKKSLADFLSETGRRRGEANTQYKQTQASMERDRVQQLDDIQQEFASRGLIQSGLFGEEQGKFQKQFSEQTTALSQQQAALLADLLSQETNYKREQQMANEQAKQEALLRRSSKYKIGG